MKFAVACAAMRFAMRFGPRKSGIASWIGNCYSAKQTWTPRGGSPTRGELEGFRTAGNPLPFLTHLSCAMPGVKTVLAEGVIVVF